MAMFELFHNPNYDFIGRRKWAYIISVLFILAGFGSMVAKGGLRYGIDFSGGTLLQVRFEKPVPVDRIRHALGTVKMGESVIQEFGDTREYLLRLPLGGEATPEEVNKQALAALAKEPELGAPEVRRVEFVGPQVGRDLQIQAIYAVLWSMAGILAYIAVRFDMLGGLASVAAIVHDVLICLSAMSLTNREMSLPILAALLTIIGYSVNDTIVAYDRVRENRLKGSRRKGEPFATQINTAINQTLSRTVLTALTVFFTTAVLYVFGGKVLEDMAFVLTVGVVTGTFSTVYIAGSLIVDWQSWRERWQGKKKKAVAKA